MHRRIRACRARANSQAAWLRAFRHIFEAIGERALFDIGLAIPNTAILPPNVMDVIAVLQSVDVAYPVKHRKAGEVMFNAETGRMIEGIGHSGWRVDGPRQVTSVCENPYPCAFDRGLITAFAQRFAPWTKVVHEERSPCRANGERSCTYVVSWSGRVRGLAGGCVAARILSLLAENDLVW